MFAHWKQGIQQKACLSLALFAIISAPSRMQAQPRDPELEALRKGVATLLATQAQTSSGSYEPTATGNVNVRSITVKAARFSRVGSIVTVTGNLSVTPVEAAHTAFTLSLPVPSTLARSNPLSGTGTAWRGTAAPVLITSLKQTAYFDFIAQSTNAIDLTFVFQYEVTP